MDTCSQMRDRVVQRTEEDAGAEPQRSVRAAIAARRTNGADGSFVSGVNEWWPTKPPANPTDST